LLGTASIFLLSVQCLLLLMQSDHPLANTNSELGATQCSVSHQPWLV